jgi:hypothetical protein
LLELFKENKPTTKVTYWRFIAMSYEINSKKLIIFERQENSFWLFILINLRS